MKIIKSGRGLVNQNERIYFYIFLLKTNLQIPEKKPTCKVGFFERAMGLEPINLFLGKEAFYQLNYARMQARLYSKIENVVNLIEESGKKVLLKLFLVSIKNL
jgi:hypothetical protein